MEESREIRVTGLIMRMIIRSLQSQNETFRFHLDGHSEGTHVLKHGSDMIKA